MGGSWRGILPLTEIPGSTRKTSREASLVQVGSLHDLGQWYGIAGHCLFLAGRILYGRSCNCRGPLICHGWQAIRDKSGRYALRLADL